MAARPTGAAGRPVATFAVIALAVALIAISASSFEYMLGPMRDSLGFTLDTGNAIVLIPELGGLALVFVAGALGDHLGQRRMIVAGATAFAVGALIVSVAPGVGLVTVGRLLEGAGGMLAGIVALALLSDTYTAPRQRSLAFSANAAVLPASWALVPIAASLITVHGHWRLVSVTWMVIAIAAAVTALVVLPTDGPVTRPEVVTPLLGGLALAAIATACTALATGGGMTAVISLCVAAAAGIGLLITMRAVRAPGLDLRLLRSWAGSLTLAGVAAVNAVSLLFFTTILLQYRFDVGLVALAIVMLPVQIAGVLGSFGAAPLVNRIGVVPATVAMMLLSAVAALLALFVGPGAPVWLVIGTACLYAVFDAGSRGPLAARVMDLAPPGGEGSAAAQGRAWNSVGSAIGGIVVGVLVFGTFQAALSGNLQARGVDPVIATALAAEVRAGAISAEVAHSYDLPPDVGIELRGGEDRGVAASQAGAYRAAGIIAAVTAGLGALLVGASAYGRRRRWPTG